jgi:hypothetical protein
MKGAKLTEVQLTTSAVFKLSRVQTFTQLILHMYIVAEVRGSGLAADPLSLWILYTNEF